MKQVADDCLVGELRRLVATGGGIEARLVAHLAELDARGLHLEDAGSLFEYCLKQLGLSENQAFYRIVAARAGRRFPIIFELLAHSEIHLTTIALIGKHLTEENHRELLSAT